MLSFKLYLKQCYYWLCLSYGLNNNMNTVYFILWQVDLGMEVDITGIATQGENYHKRFWTEKYSLNFSRDGVNFFSDTPPLDAKNAPSEEHRRVIMIHTVGLKYQINQWNDDQNCFFVQLLSLWFNTKYNFLIIENHYFLLYILKQYNKHNGQCFITVQNTKKRVKNTMNRRVFLTSFQVFENVVKNQAVDFNSKLTKQ